MKKISLLISLFLSLPVLISAQFLVKEDLFSITFPAEPGREVQDIETEGVGIVQMVSFIYEDAYAAYMVAYTEYPLDHMKQPGLLEMARDGFISSLEVELITEWPITKDEYSGIYFQAENDSNFCIIKDYIVGNRLYQIGILQAGDYPTPEATDRFINSFNLNIK